MTVEFLTNLSVSLRFTAYPKYPHESSFLLFVGRRQICFPWSIIMTTSLSIQTMCRKCRNFPHNLPPPPPIPWYFGPSAHRQLYFYSRFCYRAVWCTANAVGLWSFRSTVYTWNYEFKQISSPRISMLKLFEYVTRSLLFKYMDHRLEYFCLLLGKFWSNCSNEL